MKKSPTFTTKDLTEWRDLGFIDQTQVQAILSHLSTNSSNSEQTEARFGFNIISIAYYFGGFMILFAYTVFMGITWEDTNAIGQVVISIITLVLLGGIGGFLKSRHYQHAGGILIFAAVGIVPLLVYSIQNAIGVNLPHDYAGFYRQISDSWVPMELISITVAILVVVFVRYPLVTLHIAFWTWFVSMDIVDYVSGDVLGTGYEAAQIVSVFFGFGMLGVGFLLQKLLEKDYAFWFYLFGHICIICALSALTIEQSGILGLVYLAVYVTFVVASIWLQRKVFLVFGALGIYGYLCYLAFDVFDGALGFTFGLATIGLLIVLLTVAYQQYLQPWLTKRLQPQAIA